MSEIKLSPQNTAAIVSKLQDYFSNELDHDLGQFDAEFLIDFFAKEVGGYFYNQGLEDARVVIQQQMDSVADALYEIEKPVG